MPFGAYHPLLIVTGTKLPLNHYSIRHLAAHASFQHALAHGSEKHARAGTAEAVGLGTKGSDVKIAFGRGWQSRSGYLAIYDGSIIPI